MKRLILAVLALTTVLLASAQSRIVTDEVASNVLGRPVSVTVFLPEGFNDNPDTHYPVVYMLHGLYGTHRDWVTSGSMQGVTDELMASGEVRPMVIVMPCAGDPDVHHVQNGYFNMPDCPYEDFFFGELIPAMEAKYRCGGSKGQRAIMGLSMGGGGTIVYAQRHPDCFSSAYGMSAWLDNKHREVRGADVPDSKLTITDNSVREHSALDFMDRADESTVAALKTVKWFLDCGDDDFLLQLSMDLHMKMREKGIKCELRVRDGAHTWEYWHTALRIALPFASRNMQP